MKCVACLEHLLHIQGTSLWIHRAWDQATSLETPSLRSTYEVRNSPSSPSYLVTIPACALEHCFLSEIDTNSDYAGVDF